MAHTAAHFLFKLSVLLGLVSILEASSVALSVPQVFLFQSSSWFNEGALITTTEVIFDVLNLGFKWVNVHYFGLVGVLILIVRAKELLVLHFFELDFLLKSHTILVRQRDSAKSWILRNQDLWTLLPQILRWSFAVRLLGAQPAIIFIDTLGFIKLLLVIEIVA